MRHFKWFLVLMATNLVACSSDDSGNDSEGTGGVGGTQNASCGAADNPLFGSCIETFLAGCYAPDLGGMCTQADGVTEWSDGHRYDLSEGGGMFSPESDEPCITVEVSDGMITATRGSDRLVYTTDEATEMGTITCPDGSSFTATFEQVSEHNACIGIDCE